MELKEYQKKSLEQVKRYLESLTDFKLKNSKLKAADPELAFDFPAKAWEKTVGKAYLPKKNGLGEDLPNFYLKIPTGGGKTLLACHVIDLINRGYLKKQTGIVLWVVPTSQIYRQTLETLRDRSHPYRQILDIASAGRTVILEKSDKFNQLDVNENLVVMLLMLPSANRQNKETLKMFKDSGGFSEFFPADDDRQGHEKIIKEFPNLDCFGKEGDIFGQVVKTSLGNTFKILRPIVIIDEGHKTYSDIAQKTIRDFNPSIAVELSATPPKNSNILVSISGQELNREEMIKLDLHITNKSTVKWDDVLRLAVEKRSLLEKKAKEYESNTGEYIRPITLIQVERTGKDQRANRFIHAEDVKEYLIKQCGINEKDIAIKSSEKDDIEGIDLLSKDCRIRYIITKQALQEGWDCPFAYILAVLTNPSSQLGITQLVGRILRQPQARKTKVRELDESYVFCFRQKAGELLDCVRKGFEDEGLGDLYSRVSFDSENEENSLSGERKIRYRDKFRKLEGKIYLPKFVVKEDESWRDVVYDADILSRIDWDKVDLAVLKEKKLSDSKPVEGEFTIGLSDEPGQLIRERAPVYSKGGFEIDKVFVTRQILDLVPNPWIAFDIAQLAVKIFKADYSDEIVANNLVFIIEELRKCIESEKDRLAEKIFQGLIKDKVLYFFLLSGKSGYCLPSKMTVKKTSKGLVRNDHTQLERSLFDFIPEENFNETEKAVAWYLDGQEKLLWWYRNLTRVDYSIQGWKKHKIYPDFLFANAEAKKPSRQSKIFVVETKGIHLKNEDTAYKQNVFKFCNELGRQKDWGELSLEFADKKFEFQVIFEDEWKSKVNGLMEGDL